LETWEPTERLSATVVSGELDASKNKRNQNKANEIMEESEESDKYQKRYLDFAGDSSGAKLAYGEQATSFAFEDSRNIRTPPS